MIDLSDSFLLNGSHSSVLHPAGVLMSFLVHDIVGWHPTIESILISARRSTTHTDKHHHAGPGSVTEEKTIGDEQLEALNHRSLHEG
jgi:hypothetical protein